MFRPDRKAEKGRTRLRRPVRKTNPQIIKPVILMERNDPNNELSQEGQTVGLPENAYRELAPGEAYEPVMREKGPKPKEVTPYSVIFGIVMAVVFSAAAA